MKFNTVKRNPEKVSKFGATHFGQNWNETISTYNKYYDTTTVQYYEIRISSN